MKKFWMILWKIIKAILYVAMVVITVGMITMFVRDLTDDD